MADWLFRRRADIRVFVARNSEESIVRVMCLDFFLKPVQPEPPQTFTQIQVVDFTSLTEVCHQVKAAFHLRVFHTHVYARKTLNPSTLYIF